MKVRKGMEDKEKGEVKEKDEENKRLVKKKQQEKTKILQELHGKSGTYPCFKIYVQLRTYNIHIHVHVHIQSNRIQ